MGLADFVTGGVTRRYIVAMQQTPGALLAELLAERGIGKSEFARICEVTFNTVHRWCKNNGFSRESRKKAALALGLPATHFDAPSATEVHARKCRSALKAAVRHTAASDAERASLAGFIPPIGLEPSALFYSAALGLLRQLDKSDDVSDAGDELRMVRAAVPRR